MKRNKLLSKDKRKKGHFTVNVKKGRFMAKNPLKSLLKKLSKLEEREAA
jgi:3-deoxy-D-manno-octulosonic acid (KDO) 8-phosphate synthase